MDKYKPMHTPEEWDAIIKQADRRQAERELEEATDDLFVAVERVQKAREVLAKLDEEQAKAWQAEVDALPPLNLSDAVIEERQDEEDADGS